MLSKHGFSVATAADGIEALEVWDRGPGFSAALIDLQMPRLGALELIEKLNPRDTDLVIIIITAYATIATAVEGTKRGAFGYILKPFPPDELLLCVRNGLQRRSLIETTQGYRIGWRHIIYDVNSVVVIDWRVIYYETSEIGRAHV